MKKIIIQIGIDSTVKVETEGYVGSSCKEATKKIEEGLGVVQSDDLKPEYYDNEVANTLEQGV